MEFTCKGGDSESQGVYNCLLPLSVLLRYCSVGSYFANVANQRKLRPTHEDVWSNINDCGNPSFHPFVHWSEEKTK